MYHSILWYHVGKICNQGNLRQATRCCGIYNPLGIQLSQVRARLKVCKEKCNYFRKHGHCYCWGHLQIWIEAARGSNNWEAEACILAIIDREKLHSYWCRLNYAVNNPKERSAQIVTKDLGDGTVAKYVGQAAIEQAVFDGIHKQWFFLAKQAPVCQGQTREAFVYLATTTAS